MNCIRILFGLLLVILSTTKTQSLGHSAVVSVQALDASPGVRKSAEKDDYHQEAALPEVQENTSSSSKDKNLNQDFGLLDGFSSIYLSFVFRLAANPGISIAFPAPVAARLLPRYILYRSLIIPF